MSYADLEPEIRNSKPTPQPSAQVQMEPSKSKLFKFTPKQEDILWLLRKENTHPTAERIREVANAIGCREGQVQNWIRHRNITTRGPVSIQKELGALERLGKENLTLADLLANFGVLERQSSVVSQAIVASAEIPTDPLPPVALQKPLPPIDTSNPPQRMIPGSDEVVERPSVVSHMSITSVQPQIEQPIPMPPQAPMTPAYTPTLGQNSTFGLDQPAEPSQPSKPAAPEATKEEVPHSKEFRDALAALEAEGMNAKERQRKTLHTKFRIKVVRNLLENTPPPIRSSRYHAVEVAVLEEIPDPEEYELELADLEFRLSVLEHVA